MRSEADGLLGDMDPGLSVNNGLHDDAVRTLHEIRVLCPMLARVGARPIKSTGGRTVHQRVALSLRDTRHRRRA